MAKFERPANAIETFADLKVGDVVYEVYGIWPPQSGGPKTVMSAPVKFSEHPEYSEIHESSANSIVFDLAYPDGLTVMAFASDRNLVPGHSHNDNYLVRTAERATATCLWLREQWSASPDTLLSEIERQDSWSRYGDYDNSYADYENEAA